MLLKERHARLPAVLEQVDTYLQGITRDAYANVDLVSNEVLSRNPSGSALLHNVLWGAGVARHGIGDRAGRLARYYARSLFQFLMYAVTWMTQRSGASRRLRALDAPAHVIDTFVVQDVVRRERHYEERYFPGLAAVLRRHAKRVVIVPRFYGSLSHPLRVATVMRALHRSEETFVTEFDLVTASDLVRTLAFILRYPIAVLKLARRIRRNGGTLDAAVGAELHATLPQVTFRGYLRYLTGKRLAALARSPLTVISWFENQVNDKNFCRGVKDEAPEAVVFGCQPFVFAPPFMNCRVAEAEIGRGVVPDVVLVGGPVYLRNGNGVPHRLGPSFRYAWLWSATLNWDLKRETVVLLPYSDLLSADVVAVAAGSASLRHQPVSARAHPAAPPDQLPALPCAWHYSTRETGDLLSSASLLITSESGTAVEAVALGCSVIIVASQSTFTLNPMLEEGRGEVWELVFDAAELDRAAAQLQDYRVRNRERLEVLATWYRDAFFVQPTESSIVDAFAL